MKRKVTSEKCNLDLTLVIVRQLHELCLHVWVSVKKYVALGAGCDSYYYNTQQETVLHNYCWMENNTRIWAQYRLGDAWQILGVTQEQYTSRSVS